VKIEILGVKFDNLDKDEVLAEMGKFLESDRQHHIVLPYSEFLVRAKRDKDFRDILNRADLCIAEGIGPLLASRILGRPLRGRFTGIELIYELAAFGEPRPWRGIRNSFDATQDRQESGLKLFLFGGKKGVAEEAATRLKDKYPNLEIAGTVDGENYNDPEKHQEIIDAINQSRPQILLVALGSPQQEQWIVNHLSKIPSVKIAIGVGGAFDFISGRRKRAPAFFQSAGFEWLWRVSWEPTRLPRMIDAVIMFPFLIFWELIRTRFKEY